MTQAEVVKILGSPDKKGNKVPGELLALTLGKFMKSIQRKVMLR